MLFHYTAVLMCCSIVYNYRISITPCSRGSNMAGLGTLIGLLAAIAAGRQPVIALDGGAPLLYSFDVTITL